LGDSGQIDLKDKKESSLERLVFRVKRSVIEGVEVVEFLESDVVRHRLTSYFIQMFKEPEEVKIIQKPTPPKSQIIKEPSFSLFGWLKKFFTK
jgi:phosphate starvation-inducible protein PhoH